MQVPELPRREIETPRLLLAAAQLHHARQLANFYTEEDAHLRPWSPMDVSDLFTIEGQRIRLKQSQDSFERGSAWRWLMMRREAPDEMIGHLHFSQVVRGVFQSCMLGYEIQAEAEGQGLMFEALQAGIAEIFQPSVRLHRIQANVNPENVRSVRLLSRLGFVEEGTARDYLFINGRWRDHLTTALLNPAMTSSTPPI